jgi:hypothetical protein
MGYLTKIAVIASFVGGKPLEPSLAPWLPHLQQQVQEVVLIGQNLGRRYLVLITKLVEIVRALLLLIPYRSPQGLCIFQPWIPGFDSEAERGIANDRSGAVSGMRIPIRLTLRNLKGEFRGIAKQIVEGLGEFVSEDQGNTESNNLRFYVALLSGLGWEPSVVVTNEHTNQRITVVIGYCYLPTRRKYLFSTEHYPHDCIVRLGPRQLQTAHSQEAKPNSAASIYLLGPVISIVVP